MVDFGALVAGCLTPTSLFILLNIVIGTILVTAAFGNHHHRQHDTSSTAPPPHLNRPPSFLSRLTSFNFGPDAAHHHHHQPDHPAQPLTPPDPTPALVVAAAEGGPSPSSFLSRVASLKFSGLCRAAEPDPAVAQPRPVESKTGSEDHQGQRQIRSDVWVTSRETASYGSDDDEVDSKADDFINKFKQQLKLQRLQSLLRYRSSNTA